MDMFWDTLFKITLTSYEFSCISNHMPLDYSKVYAGYYQRKHQSSASLGLRESPVIPLKINS